jgi:GT2 family glycosyltransferase
MSSVSESHWRVLIALLVYNGEDFVGPCLSSLAQVDPGVHTADVLVLDDASPNPGWSDRCRQMSTDLGFGYYRTPRNLGIPRNMNLGMLRAVDAGYDAIVLLNSDTVVPSNLIPTMVRPLKEDDTISSTTAWSNNSSVYSIPNDQSDQLTQDPGMISWLSARLAEEFAGQSVPIPSGVGFCLMIPVPKIKDVGLMDPVFGRGYSEEIDWCLRSHTLGYSSVLVPSCFVYHAGSGITKVEGIIGDGDRTVDAHQAIIDQRYPLYGSQVLTLINSSLMEETRERGLRRIIVSAARERGYRLETSRLHQNADDQIVCFRLDPDGSTPMLTATFAGFETTFALGEGGALPTAELIVGRPPDEIRIFDRGRGSSELESEAARGATPVLFRAPYRERVF